MIVVPVKEGENIEKVYYKNLTDKTDTYYNLKE